MMNNADRPRFIGSDRVLTGFFKKSVILLRPIIGNLQRLDRLYQLYFSLLTNWKRIYKGVNKSRYSRSGLYYRQFPPIFPGHKSVISRSCLVRKPPLTNTRLREVNAYHGPIAQSRHTVAAAMSKMLISWALVSQCYKIVYQMVKVKTWLKTY